MITDLTPQQILRGKAFMTNLRSNPKKCVGTMSDENGGRCCLCVAHDTAKQLDPSYPGTILNNQLPSNDIVNFYGWQTSNPMLFHNDASGYNDSNGEREKTHSQIADLFEQEFPQLKLT